MSKEEFQVMIINYLGCNPIFIKTGTKPSFSGWTNVADGYYDVTPEQKDRACTLSDALECGLHTIYRYANGISCPHPLMFSIIEKAIEKIQKSE